MALPLLGLCERVLLVLLVVCGLFWVVCSSSASINFFYLAPLDALSTLSEVHVSAWLEEGVVEAKELGTQSKAIGF